MRLTNHDASFLYTETASGPQHGGSISIVNGELPFQTFFDHVAARLHLIPRYRQKLAFVPFNLGHPVWVDDAGFDLARHIFPHDVPPGTSMEDAIKAAIALAEPMLPRDRPLWATYVISGVEDRTLLLQLGHHAMVDGASGVDLSMVLFDLQQKMPDVVPVPVDWQPARAPSDWELAAEAIRENLKAATQAMGDGVRSIANANPMGGGMGSPMGSSMGSSIGGQTTNSATSGGFDEEERAEMLRRAGESMTRFVAEPVMTAPWNAATIGPKRLFSWKQFNFADFREIRRAFGGTINDVVLAVTSEAAARYLATHGETTNGQNLRVMCPVNVRREDESGALGNRVSGIFPIFAATELGVVKRLTRVRREMEQIKQNREAQAMELVMEQAPSIPPVAMWPTQLVGSPFDPTVMAARMPMPVLPNFGRRPPMMGFNFTCTNVPGVQVAQYVAGHEILDNLGMLMLAGNLGFGVCVTSYNQKLTFNFISDPRLMPDVDTMAQISADVFAELLQAARDVAA